MSGRLQIIKGALAPVEPETKEEALDRLIRALTFAVEIGADTYYSAADAGIILEALEHYAERFQKVQAAP